MSSDLWVGAVTTLAGAALGGGISFLLSWQQMKEVRRQRREDDAREHRRRSVDRRFQAYADFLTRARSFRNAVETYYLQPDRQQASSAEIDALLQSAYDASALVFLVVESDATYEGCRVALRALKKARAVVHGTGTAATEDPWTDLNALLGRATREFQNSARTELRVSGPTAPWASPALPGPES